MMEMLKRHAFLLSLAGGVVVIAAAAIVLVYVLYTRPSEATRRELSSTDRRAKELLGGNVYNPKVVEKMGQDVTNRQKQYEDLVNDIRGLGARRASLVKDLFPQGNDVARHTFKVAYDEQLKKFMTRLDAIKPAVAAPDNKAEQASIDEANRKHMMYADPKLSFFRPDWVDKLEAPDLTLVRSGQENLWLMEDIVAIIAQMNGDAIKQMNEESVKANRGKVEPVIANAPIKELIEIRIGGDFATLTGSKMAMITGRYRPTPAAAARARVGEKAEGGRAPTLSGRYSQARFYQVLPFRLVVVADARWAGELVRRLRDGETFITVEAWRLKPITDRTFDLGAKDLMAVSREDYGPYAIVRLEVVAESLAFQLEGGRATTVAEKKAPTPAAKEAAGKAAE
jgi:hypothetical protein